MNDRYSRSTRIIFTYNNNADILLILYYLMLILLFSKNDFNNFSSVNSIN